MTSFTFMRTSRRFVNIRGIRWGIIYIIAPDKRGAISYYSDVVREATNT